MELEFWGF